MIHKVNRLLRAAIAVVAVLAVCGLVPVSAKTLPRWWPAEKLPSTPTAVSVSETGTALVIGFPDSKGHTRLLFRPAGGPPGSPAAIPSALGYPTGTPLDVGWFADGSSLIANPGADMLAFRASGARAAVGAPQNLGTGKGEGPAEYGCHATSPQTYCPAIATSLNGRALIGLNGNLGVGVASRSPGSKGSVDMRHAQYFGRGTVLGVALDSKGGGAVIAWIDSTSTLQEAVRRPGAALFGKPKQIVKSPYAAAMATDSSGYAVISWAGGPSGPDGYPSQAFAGERAPGGAFGVAHVIGDAPNGDPLDTVPAVTSTGDALVAWTRIASNTSFGATIATEHRGHWSPQKADGPLGSQIAGVASAGKVVFVATSTGLSQTVYDVQTGSSTTTGIKLAGPKRVAASVTAMGVGASGTSVYVYGQTTRGRVTYFLLPYEARR